MDGDTVPDEDDDDVEDRLITKYGSWKAFITEMRALPAQGRIAHIVEAIRTEPNTLDRA